MKKSLQIILCFLFIIFFDISNAQVKDSVRIQIENIRTYANELNADSKTQKAIDTLEYAVELLQSEDLKNDNLEFGLYVDLSNLSGQESVRQLELSEAYADKAKVLIDTGNVNRFTDIVNFYVAQGANKYDQYFEKEALGYIAKAKEVFQINKDTIVDEVGLEEALGLEIYLLEWPVAIYSGLDLEVDMLKAYEKVEQFYLNHQDLDEAKNYYGMASFRVGRYYQADDVQKAVLYFNKAENNGNKNIRLYSNVCKGFAYLSAKQYENVPSIITKLESFDDLNLFQQMNIHEIASRLYSEQKNIDQLVYHVNQALNLLNAKDTNVDVRDFKPSDFAPIKQLKYPILLNQFAQFIEAANVPALTETSVKLYRIGLEQFSNRIDREPFEDSYRDYGIIKNRMLSYMSNGKVSFEEKKAIISRFENIENRASLNVLIKNRSIAENPSVLDKYMNEEKRIRQGITELKQKQQTLDTVYREELSLLELDLSEIEDKIKSENPSFYRLNTNTFDFDTLDIKPDSTILLFTEADDELFRIFINSDSIQVKSLGEYKPIESQAEKFLTLIKTPADETQFFEYSEKLYKLLLEGVDIKSNLIIKAEKSLLNLPFELLRREEKFLIENSAIAYTKGLFYLEQKIYGSDVVYQSDAHFYAPSYQNFMPTETELAVRGEPYDLEGAKAEVRAISELIRGKVFDREQASKSTFYKTAADASILHIAGHAFINNKDPELSHIAFSDSEEDNQLFISELYALKSNANLAVLSACNTGVGGYESGVGIVSLSEAFMYSGIPSTVSSMWSAPDKATKTIMVSFYENLKQGLAKSKALQLAKVEYLKSAPNDKLKHPYYWAGFVLYGDDAPINFSGSQWSWYYIVLFILGSILLVWFLYKKTARS